MDRADGAESCPAIPERVVARLWDEQRPLIFPLATIDGQEIQVVYRGRRRWDRGPDFTGALIASAGAELRHGDVEIHVRSSDWYAHGHQRDSHYNGVILHVVMWHDASGPVLRQDGVAVPVVALASYLAAPLEALLNTQEPALLPAPCWRGSLDPKGPLGDLLDRCGRERFAAKVARFEADLICVSPDQLLYQGIAVALGYSQNREPFRRLAERVPLDALRAYRKCRAEQTEGHGDWETGRREDSLTLGGSPSSSRLSPWERPPEGRVRAAVIPSTRQPSPRPSPEGRGSETPTSAEVAGSEALLLGAAGLLPSQRGLEIDEGDGYIAALEELWAGDGASWVGEPMEAWEWEFFRVRPANFPTRRIVALARLVDRWPEGGLAEVLAELVCRLLPKALPRLLEGLLLSSDLDSYWAGRYDFGLLLRRPGGLIGRQRAAEIAVNVLLPFLAAWASDRGDRVLAERVQEIYQLYPKRGDNEIGRYVAVQVTNLPRPRVARSACRQQGLLHLYRSYCERRQCGDCPCQTEGLRTED